MTDIIAPKHNYNIVTGERPPITGHTVIGSVSYNLTAGGYQLTADGYDLIASGYRHYTTYAYSISSPKRSYHIVTPER